MEELHVSKFLLFIINIDPAAFHGVHKNICMRTWYIFAIRKPVAKDLPEVPELFPLD